MAEDVPTAPGAADRSTPGSPERRPCTPTCVVITRDRRDELLESLGHLVALPEAPTIIVCDNGSRDGTPAAVRERFPAVQVLELGENRGAVARNLGVVLTESPYVAFADDDTWWEPGALVAGAELLEAHPHLAVVTARILVEPGGREDPICAELATSPLFGAGLPGPRLASFLAGASIVRRAAFLAAGGFEARLCIGGEEELLAAELMSAGWAICYAPALVVHHRPSLARDPHLRRRQGVRNALWFWWRRRPLASAARRTGALLVALPRDAVSLGALADAVRGLPWVLATRRVVPPAVEADYRLLDPIQMRSHARRYVS